jgi:hypothetical protein
MDSETAAAMDDVWDFPPDIFVEILLRLPTSARRRFRLVCRRWREVIDMRTTEMQSRPNTLAFVGDRGGTTVSAHIVDDLSEGRSRKLWTGSSTGNELFPSVAVVGTCNGLLCLIDRSKAGEITLVNPVTGETLPVPPLSTVGRLTARDCNAYSFAYHISYDGAVQDRACSMHRSGGEIRSGARVHAGGCIMEICANPWRELQSKIWHRQHRWHDVLGQRGRSGDHVARPRA